MTKLCILFDPNKPEGIKKIYETCLRHKEVLQKNCEFWVGCTQSSHIEISHWLKKLKDSGFKNRFLFPGKASHAFSGQYADFLLRPKLLNISLSFKGVFINLGTRLGKILSKFLYLSGKPTMLDFGYLILGPGTRVGNITEARKISDEKALELVKKFIEKEKNCYGLYVEGGSGISPEKSVVRREELLKAIIDLVPSGKIVHAGGGIRKKEEVKRLVDIGVDRIVVGTHFETNPEDILIFSNAAAGI